MAAQVFGSTQRQLKNKTKTKKKQQEKTIERATAKQQKQINQFQSLRKVLVNKA